MSHTPTDDPDRKHERRYTMDMTRQVESAPERPRSRRSVPRRVLGTIGQLFGRIRRWFGPDRHTDDEPPDFTDSAVPPPACPSVDGLSPRSFPLSYPTRSFRTVDNDVDLLVRSDDETLTLVHPDEPTTRIESDTWVPIER